MPDIKIRCVKVAEHDDTNAVLQKAFDCLGGEDLNPTWFTENECLQLKEKEKNCTLVFSFFGCPAFDHVSKLGYRVIGPQCVLTCAACKMEIPRQQTPVYNLAMKDVVVCCTNLDQKQREELYCLVRWMGGVICKDLREDVTHLVAGEVGSRKYKVAATMGKQIMVPLWIDVVWKASRLQSAVHGLDEQFQRFKCQVFMGLVVTVSNISAEERKEVKKQIEKEGGKYTGEMKMNECTHLIINEPKGQKYEFAQKWKIHVVTTEWLYESLEKGFCQEEDNYATKNVATAGPSKPKMKTSTPERRSLAGNGIADLSNISAISMMAVNETAMNNVTTMGNMTHMINVTQMNNVTHMNDTTRFVEDVDTLESVDVSKPPSDLFLDGCKIYLCGWKGSDLDKLRKIVNAGGGTRLGQIKEGLTHVIVGERVSRELEEIKSLVARPHAVTAPWLVRCFKENRLVSESDFTSKELPPLDPMSPKLKSKKLPIKHPKKVRAVSVPTPVTETTEENAADDMEDIMSQYMTGGPGDNVTVEERIPGMEGNDITQDPAVQPQPDPDETTEMEGEEEHIFRGKSFVFYGFKEEDMPLLSSLIMEKGGRVLQQNARIVPDYAVVPIQGFPVDKTVNEIVTNVWLQMCVEQQQLLNVNCSVFCSPIEINVEGSPLENCVISISGYSGVERDCLMLISSWLGATCQEYFTKKKTKDLIPNTHLIVQGAEGSKYEAAKKWGIPALSKDWILACAEQGTQLSEEKYLIDRPPDLETSRVQGPSTSVCEDMDVQRTVTPVRPAVQNIQNNTDTASRCRTSESAIDKRKGSVSFRGDQDRTGNSFGDEGDTDALMLDMESQPKDESVLPAADCDSNHGNVDVGKRDRDSDEGEQDVGAPDSKKRRQVQSKSDITETGDNNNMNSDNAAAATHSEQGQTGSRRGLRHLGSPISTTTTHLSQKENLTARARSTPAQRRVEELKGSVPMATGSPDLNCTEDTPSKFLNPNKRYFPKFDTEAFLKALETPEDERSKKKRRSSLPLDELFNVKLDEALQFTMKTKGHPKLPSSSQMVGDEVDGDDASTVLDGVVICVSKKLGTSQFELNDIVSSLGGDYRWNYDQSCTHFIFQGRQNDKSKELKVAVADGKKIVHPHWLNMCKEQNSRMDESLYPHTFKPNHSLTGLSVSRRGTPARTPVTTPARSTRRAMRERVELEQGAAATITSAELKDSTADTRQNMASKDDVKMDTSVQENAMECDIGQKDTVGSLEMRQVLSRELENIMAESKTKKRRKSKRMNSSGQFGSPDDRSSDIDIDASRQSIRQNRRTQEEKARASPAVTDVKETECHSTELPQSQSVQVVWDDPLGRIEKEKLAHKLERACSPTQDMGSLGVDIPEDAQYSEPEGDADINIPHFSNRDQQETKTTAGTPQSGRRQSQKTPTPEGPSLAFPLPKQNKKSTPPKPVELIEDETFLEDRPPPVFIVSGMAPEERADYGALIEQLGGELWDNQTFDPRCTHLVIKSIARNEKFLASVASGKWVLHVSYFEECRKEGKFVEESIHEWGSENSGLLDNLEPHLAKLAVASRLWRLRIQEEKKANANKFGAFCSFTVILCCSKNKEGNYQRLLEAGGATVLSVRPPFTKLVTATHVLMELHKVSLTQDDLETLLSSGCLCLRADYISAHLADPEADIAEFYPPEVVALKACLEDGTSGGKRRKMSGGGEPVKRSRRR